MTLGRRSPRSGYPKGWPRGCVSTRLLGSGGSGPANTPGSGGRAGAAGLGVRGRGPGNQGDSLAFLPSSPAGVSTGTVPLRPCPRLSQEAEDAGSPCSGDGRPSLPRRFSVSDATCAVPPPARAMGGQVLALGRPDVITSVQQSPQETSRGGKEEEHLQGLPARLRVDLTRTSLWTSRVTKRGLVGLRDTRPLGPPAAVPSLVGFHGGEGPCGTVRRVSRTQGALSLVAPSCHSGSLPAGPVPSLAEARGRSLTVFLG